MSVFRYLYFICGDGPAINFCWVDVGPTLVPMFYNGYVRVRSVLISLTVRIEMLGRGVNDI